MTLIRLALISVGALCLSACVTTPLVTANAAMCGFPLAIDEVAQPLSPHPIASSSNASPPARSC